jgi:hypothetical protein
MSMWSHCASTCPTAASNFGVLRDVTARRPGADALRLERLNRVDEALFPPGGDGYGCAGFAQRLGDLKVQAAATTCDQGDLAVQSKCVQFPRR